MSEWAFRELVSLFPSSNDELPRVRLKVGRLVDVSGIDYFDSIYVRPGVAGPVN